MQVFTCLALVNMLITPLNAFPWTLNGIIEAYVSLRRVQRFCDTPDRDLEALYTLHSRGVASPPPAALLKFERARFGWNETDMLQCDALTVRQVRAFSRLENTISSK